MLHGAAVCGYGKECAVLAGVLGMGRSTAYGRESGVGRSVEYGGAVRVWADVRIMGRCHGYGQCAGACGMGNRQEGEQLKKKKLTWRLREN